MKLPKSEAEYANRYALYRAYLRMKEEEEDWHGVSDAANDLRELEACLPQVLANQQKDLSNATWEAVKRHPAFGTQNSATPSPTPSPDNTISPTHFGGLSELV